MRIISGSKRGLKLFVPADEAAIRPTLERVKESIFNLIQFDLEGKVLDLFAGTGQMGIESISRGVEHAVFCDNQKDSLELVRKNIKRAGFESHATVKETDYKRYLRDTKEKFKIVFIDPPYERGLAQKALVELGKEESCLRDDGLCVVECKAVEKMPEKEGKLKLIDLRTYGTVSVYLYSVEEICE